MIGTIQYQLSLDKYTMLPHNKYTKHKEQTDQLKTLGSLYYHWQMFDPVKHSTCSEIYNTWLSFKMLNSEQKPSYIKINITSLATTVLSSPLKMLHM
jgi:hypothetical protein